jgi:gliding motility-associated-like protein
MKVWIALFFGLVCATVKAQPTVCPVNAGPDVTTSCGSPCTSLSATYFQTKATNTYTVSSIPYTPSSYTTGTTVNTPVDDQWYGIINIPFPFCFFGTAYTQCVAGSNGIITFNTGNANTYCPWSFTATIPNSGLPTNSIMTPYHDIDPSVGSSSEIRYAVSGTSPCRKFTISYYRVPMYSCNSNLATHQVVLYETTNIIEIYIQTKPGCSGWNGGRAIVGIQNNAGSAGFAAPGRNGGNWTASNEGWRFLPNGAPTSTFNWYANGASIGNTATVNVCPSVTTTYTAEAVYTNCNGTTATVNDQVVVTVPNSSGSGLTVTPSSSSICPGGNTSLTASGATNITWSPSTGLNTTTGSSVIASPSTNTVYTATGTLPNGCTATATASITVGGNAVVTLNFPPGICSGTIAPLSASGASTYTWSPATGLSGTTGSNVNANPSATTTYTVTGIDAAGCQGTASATLNVWNNPTLTTSFTNITCQGFSDGTATATPANGQSPYTYSWSSSPSQSTAIASNLGPGTYTVTISDFNNCTANGTVTISQPTALIVNATSTNVICNGGSEGTGTGVVSGGTTPYSTSWNTTPIQNGLNASNLPSGNYTFSVQDANGCVGSSNITVSEPSVITFSHTETNPLCFGDANGSIIFSNTLGGNSIFQYSIDGGNSYQSSSSFSGLVAGSYSLLVKDGNGCLSNIVFVNLNDPNQLSVTEIHTNISCSGGTDGAIDISPTGGTLPYSFSWSNSQTSEDISGLGIGIFSVSITDANNCSIQTSATLIEPPPLVLTEIHQDILCFGESTGSINLSVLGGTNPYSFSWSSGPVSEDLNSIPAGSYTQTLTDANGCVATLNVILSEPSAALNAVETHADVTCFGNCDGSVDVTTTGGTLPYQFAWTGGQNTEDIFNICVGNSALQITDNNGCSFSLPIAINGPAAGLSATSVPVYVNCFGDATGSIDVTTSGGTIPYSYSWNTGAQTEDISGLLAGTYDLLITDQNSCTFPLSVIIYEPPPLVLSETHVDIACFGQSTGSVDLTASGGASPYTYSWNSGQLTEDINGLPVGVYTQNLTDNFGCTATISITLLEPSAPLTAIETNTAVTCFGYCDGTIDVTTTGGTTPYSFSWSTGESTEDVTNACVGNPILAITDNNGCTFNLPISITGPASGVSASESHIDATCNSNNDGSIEVTTTGGTSPYSFNWSNNLTTEDIGNLVAGQYDLLITDQNSCVFNLSVVIGEPLPLLLSETHQDVLCFGQSTGAIDLTISGGTLPYAILWSDGSVTEDISNLPVGNYTVNVSDIQNCASSISISVVQPLAALNVTETHIDATCFGYCDGTADIFVTGGTSPYSFNWTNGQTIEDPSGLCAGGVGVIVTDANSCPFTLLVSISEPAQPITISGTTTDITCYGGSDGAIDITVNGGSGGYSYSWTNGAGVAEDPVNLPAGNYTVTVTDQTGVCTLDQTYDLFEPSIVIVTASTDQTICISNTTSLAALANGGVGPYTYSWTAQPSDPTLVNGANQQNPSVTPTSSTTYTVLATDALGCTSPVSDDLVVSLMEPLTLNLAITGQEPICLNESSSFGFTATGGDGNYTYTLDNATIVQSPQNVSPTATTTYSIEVSDGCGTPSVAETVTITVNPLPEIQLVSNTTEGCEDLRVNFSTVIPNCQGAVWDWNFGDGSAGSSLTTYDENATYIYEDPDTFSITITVTSTDNCVNSAYFQNYIIVRPKPIAGFIGKPQITTIMDPNIEFEDQSLGANQWYYEFVDDATFSNDTNPVHTYSDTGIFIVQQIVTTEFGCTDIAFDTIEIRPVYSMYIPNAFTPNDNGINEFYSLVGEGYVEGSFEMSIFTRWGEEVFRTKSFDNPWDGKDRFGKECPLGVYVFLAKVRSGEDKKVKTYSGKITLVR